MEKKFIVPEQVIEKLKELNLFDSLIEVEISNQFNDEGLKHGYWEEYWNSGKLYSKGNYINGKEDGYWEYYLGTEKLLSKGNYVNGLHDGFWEYYNEDGTLNTTKKY